MDLTKNINQSRSKDTSNTHTIQSHACSSYTSVFQLVREPGNKFEELDCNQGSVANLLPWAVTVTSEFCHPTAFEIKNTRTKREHTKIFTIAITTNWNDSLYFLSCAKHSLPVNGHSAEGKTNHFNSNHCQWNTLWLSFKRCLNLVCVVSEECNLQRSRPGLSELLL